MNKGSAEFWDLEWFMKTATEKGVEAVAIFATDPHAFSERVSIKMDSGTEREKAREEAFSELFNQEG